MRAHPFRVFSGLLVTVFLSTTVLSETLFPILPQNNAQHFTVANQKLKPGIGPEKGKTFFTGNGDSIHGANVSDPEDFAKQDRAGKVANGHIQDFAFKNPGQELKMLKADKGVPFLPDNEKSLALTATSQIQYADLVIDEARGKLYGADQNGNKIDVIDMTNLSITTSYLLISGALPSSIDLSPDGNELAVAQSGLSQLAFINLSAGTISNLASALSGSDARATDVIYGHTGILYALSNNGLHVIKTNVNPHVEDVVQYVAETGYGQRFGVLSGDKNTLYYLAAGISSWEGRLDKFNVSAGLAMPLELAHTYVDGSGYQQNLRLSLADDNTLLTSVGTIYNTSDLTPNAKNGQLPSPMIALPGRSFYATIYDNPSETDRLYFFNEQSSYKISELDTTVSGLPGALAVTANGNTLFVSSTGGMTKFQVGSTPPGNSVDLPQSLQQYRDFAFDLARGVIYGTDASGRIEVLDQTTGHVLNSYLLANGANPIGIDLSPDGKELAIALNGLESILFMDPNTGAQIARVAPALNIDVYFPYQPSNVIYGRAGRLYSDGLDFIQVFDTTAHTWLAKSSILLGEPTDLILTADKKYLYVNETWYPNHIHAFDVQTDVLTGVFDTPHGPVLANRFTITPDGTRSFTSEGQVWSHDLQDQIGTLEGAPGERITYIPGKNAVALTVGNSIKFISALNYQLVSTYTLNNPGQLLEMEVSADGVWMILNFSSGSVQILKIASILPEDPPGPLPSSIKYEELIVDEARGKLYGADKVGNKVDVIDRSNLSVISSYSLVSGALPTRIDLSLDGNTLAVAQSGFNRVAFINLINGTVAESPGLQNAPYATTTVYDVLYGRPGVLYALTTSGLHVINTSLNPPAEDVTQFVAFDASSKKFGVITSDKNTLFVAIGDNSGSNDFLHKFNVAAGITKPVEITYTSFNNTGYSTGYITQLSLADDSTLITSWGSTYDALPLMLKAKNGQRDLPVIALPGRNFYVVGHNNSGTDLDSLYFFDEQSSFQLSSLSTNTAGTPGAMAVTGNGNTLFVSSSGGMSRYEIGMTPPGTPASLPARVGQYRDFVFDMPRGVIYGTDGSGRVDVFDQNSGSLVKSYLLANGASPMGIDLSPDGKELAVALNGLESILFLNPATGAEIARVTPKLVFDLYYKNLPYDVIYGRDGRLYSDGNTGVTSENDYIHVFDTATHTWLGKSTNLVRTGSELSMTVDKKYLYVNESSSSNNTYVFDIQTDTPTRLYIGTTTSQEFTIAPDGSKFFSSLGQVWSGNLQQQLGTLQGSPGTLIKFVPGQNAVALSASSAIRFISASDYRLLSTYSTSSTGEALEMEVAPDGSRLIANYAGGDIFILNLSAFPPPTPTPTATSTSLPSPVPTETITAVATRPTALATFTATATATSTRTATATSTLASTFTTCAAQTQIPAAECTALVALYNSTSGASWTNHSGWLQTNMPCSWFGVVCGNGNHVTELRLASSHLVGTIPPELGNLTRLTYLFLNLNQLSGPIPSQLGNLMDLKMLVLFSNQLTGSIPSELGYLANLEVLQLPNNHLTGVIPVELGNLIHLTNLNLETNQLTGTIPAEIGNLINLQFLYLQGNQLSGELPASITNLTHVYKYNFTFDCGITSSNPTVISFVDSISPGWQAKICPVVLSIRRSDPSPTNAASVRFTINFSEAVTGVNPDDFVLTTQGITGALISSVSGSNLTRTVTVNTGSGVGSIHLDVADNDSIVGNNGITLGGLGVDNGSYTFGETYTMIPNTEIYIGGVIRGGYRVTSHGSLRQSLTGVNNGPVKILNTSGTPLIAAERVIYKVNGVNTSFSELMALPNSELDKNYWLPWYNNVDVDTQLRVGNVSGSPATVHLYIGGDEMVSGCTPTSSPFTLAAGASLRVSCTGVNNGPVQIESDQNIVVTERVIYTAADGINTSFAEMMALPNRQVSNIYWLPWYNNVDLDTQLRFANVSKDIAHVRIFVGKTEVGNSVLLAGQSTRQSFALNSGPVRIESDVPIVASERVIYKVNGINTSFSEMMALPDSQLNTTYWLPWYNNADLDTQLRVGNVEATQPATVHLYIGGVEVTGSPFVLLAGQSTRQSFALNSGPVRIESDVPIVVSERVIYKVSGINTSFSEMMALPDSQLNTTYWLPWYNNIDLDTQLRFGVP